MKSSAEVKAKQEQQRAAAYDAAMKWVGEEAGRTAYGASVLLDADGNPAFPGISENGLRNRLSGKVDTQGLQHASMAHAYGLCMCWSRKAHAAAVC